ncbi:MAG: glycosyltransferase family 39 protein, partial [Elusimicrobia bacterium]|nr:glycosyltransferase family 39 protein [Elusimicrobiota bacterium]
MEKEFKNFTKETWFKLTLFMVFVVGGILRLIILLKSKNYSLLGDEAVMGLMAKHILELKEFPIYIWSAHYAGTLFSYFGAVYFFLFGVSSNSFRLLGLTVSLVLVVLVYKLAKKIYGYNTGLIAAALIAVPAYYILSFSELIVGVYSEGLVFTTLILLLFCKRISEKKISDKEVFLLSLTVGVGLWLSPFVLPVVMAMGVFLLLRFPKNLNRSIYLYAGVGFLVGYLPVIIYSIQYPTASAFRMGARMLDIERDILLLSRQEIFLTIIKQVLHRVALVPEFIINMPRLSLPLLGVEKSYLSGTVFKIASFGIMAIYISAILYAINFCKAFIKKIKSWSGVEFLIIYVICFTIFYSFFVDGQKSRYLVPLIIPIVIFLAKFIVDIAKKYGKVFLLIVPFVLVYNLFTCLVSADNPVKEYGALTEFLIEKKIFYGYSDYWVAYPVVFESKEKVIVSPTLFTATYDRRFEYTEKVRRAEYVAYIFDANRHGESEKKFKKKIF